MTEKKRIKLKLESDGRNAYNKAKSGDNAFILMGNSIYRMSADGSKEKIVVLTSTKVKAKQKKFTI